MRTKEAIMKDHTVHSGWQEALLEVLIDIRDSLNHLTEDMENLRRTITKH